MTDRHPITPPPPGLVREWQNNQHFRRQLLAIAAELDGKATTSEGLR